MWPLYEPSSYGGIGKGSCKASNKCKVYGCLENGMLFPYEGDVIDGEMGTDDYTKPALYGMDKLRAMNCYIGCNRDTMHLVPMGHDSEIIWPPSTVHLQCERAQSGHMILVMSHWNRYDPAKHKKMVKEHDVRLAADMAAFDKRQRALL